MSCEVFFDLLQGIPIDKIMDIDISGSHVPSQMSLYRNRIQPALFSNLSYRISLFIKPIRIFDSRKFIAVIVA